MRQSWAEEQRLLHKKGSFGEKVIRNIAKEVGRKQSTDEMKSTRIVGITDVTMFFRYKTLLPYKILGSN